MFIITKLTSAAPLFLYAEKSATLHFSEIKSVIYQKSEEW